MTVDVQTARELQDSWLIALEAAATPKNTILAYMSAVRLYLAWCESEGIKEDLEQPEQVRLWNVAQLARGLKPRTVNARLAALRAFTNWVSEEIEEYAGIDLSRVAWAQTGKYIPAYLTEEQKDALVATCGVKAFADVRDAAVISLMFDSLLRPEETASLRAKGDIDKRRRSVRVRRGKGNKERVSGFSPQTALFIDRYDRARAKHKHAASPAYWLGKFGSWGYDGIYEMFQQRAEKAGIGKVHPHMTRNGGAVAWKFAGGSTEGLMAIGGWESLEMVQHYVRAAEIDLALGEQQRLMSKAAEGKRPKRR